MAKTAPDIMIESLIDWGSKTRSLDCPETESSDFGLFIFPDRREGIH
jgi:hypothetical protein